MGELSAKAREGKLKPADMQGGDFTISLARRHRRHVLHADRQRAGGGDPRRVDALEDGAGLGRQGSSCRASCCRCRSSYDHRVIDGALAARFSAKLAQLLARPAQRCCSEGGDAMADRGEGPRHRGFQGRAGDHVLREGRATRSRRTTPLVKLESDKATMEVPSPAAGKVEAVEGQGRRHGVARARVILTLEAARRRAAPARDRAAARRPQARRPRAARPARAAARAATPTRMRGRGARRRSRRLHRRVPRRRPRHEGRC